jgi:hypothetical protein
VAWPAKEPLVVNLGEAPQSSEIPHESAAPTPAKIIYRDVPAVEVVAKADFAETDYPLRLEGAGDRGCFFYWRTEQQSIVNDEAKFGLRSKYPPAEPGALVMGPLEAADGVADAAPILWRHLKVAIIATCSVAQGGCLRPPAS